MSDSLAEVENNFKVSLETVAELENRDLVEAEKAASKLEQDGGDMKPTVQDETDVAVGADNRDLEKLTISSNGRNGDELPAPEVTIIGAVKTVVSEIIVNQDEEKTLENGTDKCARKLELEGKGDGQVGTPSSAVGEKDDGYLRTSSPSAAMEVVDSGAQEGGRTAAVEMKMEVDVLIEETDGAAKTKEEKAEKEPEVIPEEKERGPAEIKQAAAAGQEQGTPEKDNSEVAADSKGKKRARTATPKKKAKIEELPLRRSTRQRRQS